MKTKTRQSIKMKATISEFDNLEATLWAGEAISVDWDSKTSEFVLRGKAGEDEFEAFMASVLNQDKVVVGIEDPTSTQLVWRGQVGSAKFRDSGPDRLECCLTMSLEDWYGIFPGFSGFYFC
jgi:hypothetical protein